MKNSKILKRKFRYKKNKLVKLPWQHVLVETLVVAATFALSEGVFGARGFHFLPAIDRDFSQMWRGFHFLPAIDRDFSQMCSNPFL